MCKFATKEPILAKILNSLCKNGYRLEKLHHCRWWRCWQIKAMSIWLYPGQWSCDPILGFAGFGLIIMMMMMWCDVMWCDVMWWCDVMTCIGTSPVESNAHLIATPTPPSQWASHPPFVIRLCTIPQIGWRSKRVHLVHCKATYASTILLKIMTNTVMQLFKWMENVTFSALTSKKFWDWIFEAHFVYSCLMVY